MPSSSTLGSLLRSVSAEILTSVRESISKSPVKVHFEDFPRRSRGTSQSKIHPRNNRTGARSVVKTINHAKRSVIPECLPDAYDDDENDESEDELIEKRIRENFLSRHDSVFSIDDNSPGGASGPFAESKHGTNFLSDEKAKEIESQILLGTFNESIDQLDEEMKADEERERRFRQ